MSRAVDSAVDSESSMKIAKQTIAELNKNKKRKRTNGDESEEEEPSRKRHSKGKKKDEEGEGGGTEEEGGGEGGERKDKKRDDEAEEVEQEEEDEGGEHKEKQDEEVEGEEEEENDVADQQQSRKAGEAPAKEQQQQVQEEEKKQKQKKQKQRKKRRVASSRRRNSNSSSSSGMRLKGRSGARGKKVNGEMEAEGIPQQQPESVADDDQDEDKQNTYEEGGEDATEDDVREPPGGASMEGEADLDQVEGVPAKNVAKVPLNPVSVPAAAHPVASQGDACGSAAPKEAPATVELNEQAHPEASSQSPEVEVDGKSDNRSTSTSVSIPWLHELACCEQARQNLEKCPSLPVHLIRQVPEVQALFGTGPLFTTSSKGLFFCLHDLHVLPCITHLSFVGRLLSPSNFSCSRAWCHVGSFSIASGSSELVNSQLLLEAAWLTTVIFPTS